MCWMQTARASCHVAVLASLLAVGGCGGAQARFVSHMDRGKSYFAQGEFVRANLEFRNALQIEPNSAQARLLAAKTAEKLRKFSAAAALYQSVVDSSPDDIEARAGLGRLFVASGAAQRALDLVGPGITRHPDSLELLIVRATAHIQLQNDAAAALDADRVLKLAPWNEEAIALRAGLYRKAGDLPHAIELVAGGVAHDPQSADLHEVLASLYALADEPVKAEEQLRLLVRQKPADIDYRKRLAQFLMRAHRIDDAQTALVEAVRDLPDNDDAKLTLVGFVSAQRNWADAESMLRGYIARRPDDYALRFGLAELQQSKGATREALETYDEVIRTDGVGPKGLLARDRVAAIYLSQGNKTEAEKLIDQVLNKNPRDDAALLMRGSLALERHDPATAVTDLRAVLRDQPGSASAQRLLARAYIANGAPALAEQALRAAIDTAPADTSIRIELAQLLIGTGQGKQAVTLLQRAVESNPDAAAPREALVKAEIDIGDPTAALAAAKDLETLRPDDAIAPYLAGVAARDQGNLDDAQRAFERALQLQPRGIEPLAALARLEVARGQSAKAIARVQNTIGTVGANDAGPVNLLGELYLLTNDIGRATEALTRATTLAPQWSLPHRNLAMAKIAAHDMTGAVAEYETALKLAPTDARAVADLAALLETQGRFDEAIARYQALYQRDPQSVPAANGLAMLLVTYKTDHGSLDRARDLTARFASSNDGGLLDTSGWVHFKRGEYADALKILERAAERAPERSEIRYHLAMAQLRVGQNEQARTNLQAALSHQGRSSWSADARTALARLGSPTG